MTTEDNPRRALQNAWNDFCTDTHEHPEFISQIGDEVYADFGKGNFVRSTIEWLETISAAAAQGEPT